MRVPFIYLGVLSLAVFSCKKQEIKTYTVAKETTHPAAPTGGPHTGIPGMMPGGVMLQGGGGDPHAGIPGMGGADPHAGLGGARTRKITDAAPDHWEKGLATGIRAASYNLTGEGGEKALVTISSLRWSPSSRINTANMWREQLGQPPVDEASVSQLPTVKTGLGEGVLVDVTSAMPNERTGKPERLVGAVVQDGDTAWYIKLAGDSALVAAERNAFLAWVPTLKASAPEPAKIPMHGTKPGDGEAAAPTAATVATGDGLVTWTLPAGWAPTTGSPARYATIGVSGADGAKGEVAVTHFPGDVGGDLANVNRWRGQIGLASIADSEMAANVTNVTAGPKTIQVMDATGAQVRCTAGWVKHGGETWFFKFTGPDALVGAEKSKFTNFLESLRFTQPD